MPTERPIWVAHRGDAEHYLENTLAAFAGAAALGLTHVELDVQVTADGVPLVLHDPGLSRTHGLRIDVRRRTLAELSREGIFDPARFDSPVPTLGDFTAWMQETPRMHAFVEIKKESLKTRGRQRVLDVVAEALNPIAGRYTLISYDARVLGMARDRGLPIGYVLPTMGRRYRTIAERLAPELLFADWNQILAAGAIWRGRWDWAAFEVEDSALARRLAKLGVRYLETMTPGALVNAA